MTVSSRAEHGVGDFGHDEIRQRRSLWRIHAAERWHKPNVIAHQTLFRRSGVPPV
jgi:hypothetical protein